MKQHQVIAHQRFFKNKIYAVINIGGLMVGAAVALFIGFWIAEEFSIKTVTKNNHLITNSLHALHQNIKQPNLVPVALSEELRISFGNNFELLVLTSTAPPVPIPDVEEDEMFVISHTQRGLGLVGSNYFHSFNEEEWYSYSEQVTTPGIIKVVTLPDGDVGARQFEQVLAGGLLGADTQAKYGTLGNSDRGQIREQYLRLVEKVDPALRAKFLKLYAYY